MTEKKIAYLITDHGIDGREPETIISAFWNETERDKALHVCPNKAWRNKAERIVHHEKEKQTALAKLHGLDKLVLNLG